MATRAQLGRRTGDSTKTNWDRLTRHGLASKTENAVNTVSTDSRGHQAQTSSPETRKEKVRESSEKDSANSAEKSSSDLTARKTRKEAAGTPRIGLRKHRRRVKLRPHRLKKHEGNSHASETWTVTDSMKRRLKPAQWRHVRRHHHRKQSAKKKRETKKPATKASKMRRATKLSTRTSPAIQDPQKQENLT